MNLWISIKSVNFMCKIHRYPSLNPHKIRRFTMDKSSEIHSFLPDRRKEPTAKLHILQGQLCYDCLYF